MSRFQIRNLPDVVEVCGFSQEEPQISTVEVYTLSTAPDTALMPEPIVDGTVARLNRLWKNTGYAL